MLLVLVSIIMIAIIFLYFIFLQYKNFAVPMEYKINTHYIQSEKLGPYYVSLLEKLSEYHERCEHGGIIVNDPWSGNRFFHPIKNAHYIMALYERYLETGEESDKIDMINIAEALLFYKTVQEDGTYVWYLNQQSFKGQKLPWIHGMAQGLVVAALLRIYELTDDEKYLSASRDTLKSFQKSIQQGGVRSDDITDGVFYEEYAFWEPNRQNHTLNGMMAALFGIYDFWKVTREESARILFDEGLRTIRNNLMRYDFPFCSSYDLRHEKGEKHIFNPRYNAVHVAHLTILSKITGDNFFAGVAICWDRKLRDQINRIRQSLFYVSWKFNNIIENIKWRGAKRVFIFNLKRLMQFENIKP